MKIIKIKLSIQSVSDIITNSSSETFCRIESDEQVYPIFELLDKLINGKYENDPECAPAVYIREFDQDYDKAGMPEEWVEIACPYGWGGAEFYKAGLSAVLDKYFKDQYKTIYEGDEGF